MMVLRNNDDGAIAATGVGDDENRLNTKTPRITCRRVERNSTWFSSLSTKQHALSASSRETRATGKNDFFLCSCYQTESTHNLEM
jgi:hypothetical protein